MCIQAVEKYGKDNIIVILGTPDAESSQMYAETLINCIGALV